MLQKSHRKVHTYAFAPLLVSKLRTCRGFVGFGLLCVAAIPHSPVNHAATPTNRNTDILVSTTDHKPQASLRSRWRLGYAHTINKRRPTTTKTTTATMASRPLRSNTAAPKADNEKRLLALCMVFADYETEKGFGQGACFVYTCD